MSKARKLIKALSEGYSFDPKDAAMSYMPTLSGDLENSEYAGWYLIIMNAEPGEELGLSSYVLDQDGKEVEKGSFFVGIDEIDLLIEKLEKFLGTKIDITDPAFKKFLTKIESEKAARAADGGKSAEAIDKQLELILTKINRTGSNKFDNLSLLLKQVIEVASQNTTIKSQILKLLKDQIKEY